MRFKHKQAHVVSKKKIDPLKAKSHPKHFILVKNNDKTTISALLSLKEHLNGASHVVVLTGA